MNVTGSMPTVYDLLDGGFQKHRDCSRRSSAFPSQCALDMRVQPSILFSKQVFATGIAMQATRGPRIGDAASLWVPGVQAAGMSEAHACTTPRMNSQVELHPCAWMDAGGGPSAAFVPHEVWRGAVAGDPWHRLAARKANTAAVRPDAAPAGPAVAGRCACMQQDCACISPAGVAI